MKRVYEVYWRVSVWARQPFVDLNSSLKTSGALAPAMVTAALLPAEMKACSTPQMRMSCPPTPGTGSLAVCSSNKGFLFVLLSFFVLAAGSQLSVD